ncbi:MAG: DUF2232 domain-containing protein [Candidatus Binatia bacterium]
MPNARAIVSGACCTTALCCGGLIGPPGSALALLALPLPVLVVGGIGGTLHAAVSSLAAGGVVTGLLGWPVGAGFLALVGMPTVLTVLLLRNAWRLEVIIPAAVGATLVGGLVLAYLYAGEPAGWAASASAIWQSSFDTAVGAYRDMGMSTEAVAELETARAEMGQQLTVLLPSLLVVCLGALWLGNLGLSRGRSGWPQLMGLARWRNPDWMIWLFVASGFATFGALEIVSDVAANIFLVTLACYFAQGMAIVSYFFQRFALPRTLRVATYVVIAVQYVAAALVVAIGIFDLWGDFRNLATRPADAAVGGDSE